MFICDSMVDMNAAASAATISRGGRRQQAHISMA